MAARERAACVESVLAPRTFARRARYTLNMHGSLFAAALVFGSVIAAPALPVVDSLDAEHARHDDHTRPPLYDDLDALREQWEPVFLRADPDYPLAVGFVPADSSNYSNGGIVPEFIVVHTMQGYYQGSMSWFQNPAANVSAHFVMQASDGEVTQMVRLDDKAWHVGAYNGKSLGIEHEGWVDEPNEWYTWAAYTSSAVLTRWMADRHGIPLDRDHIIGHIEVPGASHTDPGPHWDWDLYMALILELVSEGVVDGIVVDASRACTLTATADTWLTSTIQAPAELGNNDKCLVSSGAQLDYYWAEDPVLGKRRLVLAPGNPCEGIGELGSVAYAPLGDFAGFCAPEDMVVGAGSEVQLDGGPSTFTNASGRFSFSEVGAGAHTIDVLEDAAFFATTVPVELDPTPGVRVVAVVDPVPDDDTGGDPTGGDPTDGDPTGGDPTGGDPTGGDPTGGDPTGGDPTGGDPTGGDPTGGDPTNGDSASAGDDSGGSSDSGDSGDSGDGSGGDGQTGGALPHDYGVDAAYGDEGCACATRERSGGAPALLLLTLGLIARRRRTA